MAVDSIRTCAGCGGAEHPDAMERFVLNARAGLIHDLRSKAPGRGTHVHADLACLAKAARFGFRKSFRTDVEVDAENLVIEVGEAIRRRVDEAARVAVHSGGAAIGQNAVELAMKADNVGLLLIASDAGDATRRKYESNADRKRLEVVNRFDGETIGGWSGRDFVAVMSLDGSAAQRMQRDIQSLERLKFFEA